jgi:hypothetical protein
LGYGIGKEMTRAKTQSTPRGSVVISTEGRNLS